MRSTHFLIFLWALLLNACWPRERIENVFRQADSLLAERPDSALSLLQALPALQELSRKEAARYGLLVVQATDKSILPTHILIL